MAKGILQKFQTTEEGLSILIKAGEDQLEDVARMHKKEILMTPLAEGPQIDRNNELWEIKMWLQKGLERLFEELERGEK